MFTGIEHFAIASPNPRRLVDFYTEFLGFSLTYEYAENYFIQAANGVLVEIVPAEGEALPAGKRSPGMRHMAIAVSDFDQAYRTMQDQGFDFEGDPYSDSGNRLVFFRDPDGNLLHLIQRHKPLV